jgi:hypothetical protein
LPGIDTELALPIKEGRRFGGLIGEVMRLWEMTRMPPN